MGRHRRNLVLSPLESLPCLTLAGTVSCPHLCAPNICGYVKFFTISAVLLVLCVAITTGVVAVAVLSEELNALRHSPWPHTWHWHGVGTEQGSM